MKIGIGLVSYHREDYRAQSLAAIHQHLGWVDELVTVIDVAPVAAAKNQALTALMDAGCTSLFLCEDDYLVTSPNVISGYLVAAWASGIEHMNFHQRGSANPTPVGTDPTGLVTYWPNYLAGWSYFTRRSLAVCGLFDEDMGSALDHVEHTMRLAKAGFHPLPGGIGETRAADATGSERWLKPIEGSEDRSIIDHDGRQRERLAKSRAVWKAKDPETYGLLFLA